jgi:hypothetical protein
MYGFKINSTTLVKATSSVLNTINSHVKRGINVSLFLVPWLLRMCRTLNWGGGGLRRPHNPSGHFGADKKILSRNSTDRRNTKVAYTRKNLYECHLVHHKSHINWSRIVPGPPHGQMTISRASKVQFVAFYIMSYKIQGYRYFSSVEIMITLQAHYIGHCPVSAVYLINTTS